ncbi:MAG: hypothetical protein ACI9OJ_003997 [Myxococcota bacterium]|jgi:hypothetical protein
MGLLDDILENQQGTQKDKREREKDFMAVPVTAEPVAQDQLDIQKGHETWFGDPTHTICGMSPGNRFEMVDCGEELDGIWVIAKVNAARGSRDSERKLFASREAGGPPYIEVTEEVAREEIELGRLIPLKRDITREAAPSPD